MFKLMVFTGDREYQTSFFRYDCYPKTTNAERHNIRGAKKNGGNNGKRIFCTNFGKKNINL